MRAERAGFIAVVCGAPLVVGAAEIEVQLDAVTFNTTSRRFEGEDGGPFKAKFPDGVKRIDPSVMNGKFRDFQFEKFAPFNTEQLANGIFLANSTKDEIKDFHLKLLGDDTFKATSTGGKAFPTGPTLSADKKTLTFDGGSLADGKTIWAFIPSLADDKYEGKLTPEKPPKPPEKKEEKPDGPKTGNDGTDQGNQCSATFSPVGIGGATLQLSPGAMNFAYDLLGPAPLDPILGSLATVEAMQLLGPEPSLPGSFRFSDAELRVRVGSLTMLAATLTNVLLYPDADPGSGFGSLLQADLAWDMGYLAAESPFLTSLYDEESTDLPLGVFFRSNLLGLSGGDLTLPVNGAAGSFSVAVVPEPGVGVVIAIAAAWKRRRRG